jgi:hypothetical protein
VGFDKAETEWLRRASLRMLGNIGVELLQEVPACKPSRGKTGYRR